MPPNIDLRKVTIEYCKNNKLWRKTVNLDRAGGLWWNNPAGTGSGTNFVPGQPENLGDCPDRDPDLIVGGKTACWWDNATGQWVCPENLG